MSSFARSLARFRPTRLPSLSELVALAQAWHERAKSRRLLLTLDDRALRDIGLDRAAAKDEGNRPFWR